jgi:hypothetical protein
MNFSVRLDMGYVILQPGELLQILPACFGREFQAICLLSLIGFCSSFDKCSQPQVLQQQFELHDYTFSGRLAKFRILLGDVW